MRTHDACRMHGLFAPVGSRGRRASVCLAACGHIRQPDPARGEDTELAARKDGTSQRTHLAGVDARHSTYHRNRCRRRSRSYCQPARAREKTAPRAAASRVTDHARASRVRAGPCAPPVRLASARPPADRRGHRTVPVRGVGVRDSTSILLLTIYLAVSRDTSYLHTTVNMYSCS